MATAGIQPFLEALDEPAMVLEGGVIRFANQAARALLGAGIEGNDVRLAIRHPQALEHILPGAPGDVDITGIGQFGRPWTLSIRKIDERSLLIRLIDRSAAIAAEKMRVDFVANASHELRTPLATILGYSETLADPSDVEPEIRATFGSTIRSEAERMLRIIEDLMSLSRIEAGRFVTPSERVPVGEVVASAVESAGRIAGAGRCRIELDVEDSLPEVLADRAQLMQLLGSPRRPASPTRRSPSLEACPTRSPESRPPTCLHSWSRNWLERRARPRWRNLRSTATDAPRLCGRGASCARP